MRIIDSETVKSVLYPGMEIKNYKELCSLLDEKQKTGEAKQIQLGNWQLYFSYRKQGHKFIIEKFLIYQKRKLTEEPRGIILFLQKILQIIYCVLYVQALRRKQMQELNG